MHCGGCCQYNDAPKVENNLTDDPLLLIRHGMSLLLPIQYAAFIYRRLEFTHVVFCGRNVSRKFI